MEYGILIRISADTLLFQANREDCESPCVSEHILMGSLRKKHTHPHATGLPLTFIYQLLRKYAMDKRMTIAAMAEQVLQRFGPQEERHHD